MKAIESISVFIGALSVADSFSMNKLVINLKRPMPASNDCLPHAAMNLGAARGVGMRPVPGMVSRLVIQPQLDAWCLFRLDKDGGFVRAFGEGRYVRPHGLRLDPDGNIWTTDVNGHTVTKMNPRGEVLMTLGVKGQAGDWNEAFDLLHQVPARDRVKDFLTVFIAQHNRTPPSDWDGVIRLASKGT